uniref:Lipase domain-containing protein n=1 Tax=Lygus hesperus TaxID=30085 RepID=A0A0K8TEW1_LYGHE
MDNKIAFCGVLCLLSAFVAQSLPTESSLNWKNPVSSAVHTLNNFMANGIFSEQYDDTVLFYLYTDSTVNNTHQLWAGNVTALKSSDFNASKSKTLVLTHGFWDEVNSAFDNNFKNALLKYDDVNVIAVDWSYFTKNVNYLRVVSETKNVGSFIGQFVDFLIDQTGLSPDQVHLIGHSIGAHASGFAAKYLKGRGRTVARVSGLDPAWPGFYTAGTDERLSSTDAKFVDCVHTCGGGLGFPSPICQADFYPNGGKNVQPGCSWVDFGVCSHGRSFDYYAESIDPTHLFVAQTW